MTAGKRRSCLFLVALGGILAITVSCVLLYFFIESFRNSAPPYDLALEKTELILVMVEDHPGESFPSELPLDLRTGTEQCWEFLQTAMVNNDNQYNLRVIGVYGEYGTPTGHGATEILIEVVFPDETDVEMYYYNYRLEVCREK